MSHTKEINSTETLQGGLHAATLSSEDKDVAAIDAQIKATWMGIRRNHYLEAGMAAVARLQQELGMACGGSPGAGSGSMVCLVTERLRELRRTPPSAS